VVTTHRSYRPQRISVFLAFLEMHLKPFLITGQSQR
jgi:hypothetical protein